MAITGFTGYPGAGKSYALIEQVIIPGLVAGRRVVTNVDGINPQRCTAFAEAVLAKAERKGGPGREVGTVEVFSGEEAMRPGFFPTEEIPDTDTRVKAGDLVVFDEWRLYVPRRGKVTIDVGDEKVPYDDLEKFLRWHRHLVDAGGVACDVAIATQAVADIHPDFRPLMERNYKFNKLRSIGLNKSYAWFAWNGSAQLKGEHYAHGVGKYKAEIFPLYESYKGGSGTELKTSKREDIWSQPKTWFTMLAPVPLIGFGIWKLWAIYSHPVDQLPTPGGPGTIAVGQTLGADGKPIASAPAGPVEPPVSPWRILGKVDADNGTRVIVTDDKGSIRMLLPGDFTFDEGRPVSGTVDGKLATASDQLPVTATSAPLVMP